MYPGALLELGDPHAVVDFAIQALGRNQDRIQPALAGGFEAARVQAVRDHGRDLGVDTAGLDAGGDGLEMRAAPREQDPESFRHK